MRQTSYEADAMALGDVYRAAFAELDQRYHLDDLGRSKLVAVVLRSYFAEAGTDKAPCVALIIETAINRFLDIASPEAGEASGARRSAVLAPRSRVPQDR